MTQPTPAIVLSPPTFRSHPLSDRATRASTDSIERSLFAVALVTSVVACIHYLRQGTTLAYYDAPVHLMIARRIVDNPTPGLGQSGGLWPALIHWMALPFVWNDWLYRTGLAGSLLSMAGYIVSVVFIYRLGRDITGLVWPGLLAATIFGLNPNVLYLQSTPMTELPLVAAMLVAVSCLVRWVQTDDIQPLGFAILAVIVATGTRYEGWVLWGCMVVTIAYFGLRLHWGWVRTRDYLLYFGVFGGVFMAFWIGWNGLILGDFLGFLRGEDNAAANWVTQLDPTVGHPWVSARTYWLAMSHINGAVPLMLAVVGLALFLFIHRLQASTAGVLILVFPVFFYIPLLIAGQRPLHVPEIAGDAYNVRFALITVPICALMIGFLAHCLSGWLRSPRMMPAAMLVTACLALVVLRPIANIALAEPLHALTTEGAVERRDAADWMREHYPGHGAVLIDSVGNEQFLFWSGVPMGQVIYEGNNQNNLWKHSLESPDRYVEWIVYRSDQPGPDRLWSTLHEQHPDRLAHFEVVYTGPSMTILQRNTRTGVAP